MLITEGDTEQCQAGVTFDRELEGCIAPELKWREWTGRGLQRSSRDSISSGQHSPPKNVWADSVRQQRTGQLEVQPGQSSQLGSLCTDGV